MQTPSEIFDEASPERAAAPGQNGLVIGTASGKKLTKAQQAFNRLVRRIEKLRAQIEARRAGLEDDLKFLTGKILPLEEEEAGFRVKLVLRLRPFVTDSRLTGKRRARLRALLTSQLRQALRGADVPPPEIDALYKELTGKTIDEHERDSALGALEDMRRMFESQGLDVDPSKLSPDAHPETIVEELERLRAQLDDLEGAALRQQQEARGAGKRRKSKKQEEREARERAAEELKQRDLGRLYRQLAKLLHPDLEQDPALRAEKEAAMKTLTTAYKNEDLHSLLRLELAWILRAQADADRLTEEKLATYNAVLKEQVKELEEDLAGIALHPRFQPLQQRDPLVHLTGHFDRVGVQRFHRQVISEIQSVMKDLDVNALKTIRDILDDMDSSPLPGIDGLLAMAPSIPRRRRR